jgi:hypothetical protein
MLFTVFSGGDLLTTTITYEYDGMYRLTEATYTGSITATYAYVYDTVYTDPQNWFFRRLRAREPLKSDNNSIFDTPHFEITGVPSCQPWSIYFRAVRLIQ